MENVLIIGASSGIGKALALKFASKGYLVGITGRRANLLNEIVAMYPKNIISAHIDCTQSDVVEKLGQVVEQMRGIDILVFSAGTGDLNPGLEGGILNRTNQLNVLAFAKICSWAFTHFKNKGHGHLVAISSIAGLRGSRHAPSYGASKAYQINYLEGLRQKAANECPTVKVTDLRPGFVATAMAKGEGQFWVATPKKAANQMYRAITKKQPKAYVTKRWRLIAVVLKILPTWLHKKL